MIPEKSVFTCRLQWLGKENENYDTFDRLHEITLPRGAKLIGGGAHLVQNPAQTNPEELFCASVAACMMMTILAVFCRSKVLVTAYEDTPEALLELVDRRYRITRVTLKPRITIQGTVAQEKLDNLIAKAHANCFITLSVRSDVTVEPSFVFV